MASNKLEGIRLTALLQGGAFIVIDLSFCQIPTYIVPFLACMEVGGVKVRETLI